MPDVKPDEIHRHLAVLTREIGVRLVGSAGERQAAAYIAGQLRRHGADVSLEVFPVRERAVTDQTLEIFAGGIWTTYPCSLLSNAPGTDGHVIEGPIAVMDAQTGY